MLRSFCFLIPGDWWTATGGFQYDRRLAEALTRAGWAVDARRLDANWPEPDALACARAATVVEALPDGTVVVADGLAYGVLDDLVAAHAERLRWVALVHHPLHLETGLTSPQGQRLFERERRALSFARRVVVTSSRTAQDVAALGVPMDRIDVVEPGTDLLPPRQPLPAPARPAQEPAPVRLLCVATLTPRKGHADLLKALAGLLELPWELHCVGSLQRDLTTAAFLQEAANEFGLSERVRWHGEVDAATLRAHYAAADLFVLASLHEGYGMVVAEAVAAGLPVLTTHAGALAQTLPPQAGWKVPPGDVPALQAALRRLIGEPPLRRQLAHGAREAAGRLPSWPSQAVRFASVLQALP